MTHQEKYVFTSESVSEGHPDKICDQVSDAIVDEFLSKDPNSRVAVETLVTSGRLILAGEVRGPDSIDNKRMEELAREVIRDIGYEQETFHWKTVDIQNFVHKQSDDIALGVDEGTGQDIAEGAGDQGIMFGYACTDTPMYMPASIHYSHRILEALAQARHSGEQPLLGPDAKSQISLEFVNHRPVRATSIVVSTQHDESLTQQDVREIVRPYVEKVLPEGWMCDDSEFYVNPTGRFVIGGPHGDAGLTGRKIIVDTYGGASAHGGGAFSGKDPSKVDRSAAYMCRYMAKNVVAAGLADACSIQLSYAIGISKPISVYVYCHGTEKVDPTKLTQTLCEMIDLTPAGIRKHLNLNRPIYRKTAAYGHFGREPGEDGSFSWEKTDMVEKLRSVFQNELQNVA